MRVASNHLVRDAPDHLLDAEGPALPGDVGMEDDLQEQVAQLGGQLVVVAVVDGLGHLVGLLDRHGLHALVGLLAVPGTAAGGAQAGDQLDEAGEGETGGRGLEHRDHSRLDQGRMAGQISQRRSPPLRGAIHRNAAVPVETEPAPTHSDVSEG